MDDWTRYKEHLKKTSPVNREIVERADAEAEVISAMIRRRAELGLTQRELAALCGIPQVSIARIETGRTTPRLSTLTKILGILGLSLYVGPLSKS